MISSRGTAFEGKANTLDENPAVVVKTIDRLEVDGVRACSPGR